MMRVSKAAASLLLLVLLLLVEAGAALADRDPSSPVLQMPGGLSVQLVAGKLVVRRGALRATIEELGNGRLEGLRVSSDRRSITVTEIVECTEEEERRKVSVDQLAARIEQVAALAHHKAGRFAAAADGLRKAIALEPGLDRLYLDLAAALVRAGSPAEAAKALMPLVARNPAFAYYNVISSAVLAPLASLPPIAALRAGPGKADADALISFSQRNQLWALEHTEASWGKEDAFESQLHIFDLRGQLLLTLPLVDMDDTCDEPGCSKDGIRRGARAKVAKRRAVAGRLLAELGFDVPADLEQAKFKSDAKEADSDSDESKRKAFFALARIGVVVGKEGNARVLSHNTVLGKNNVDGKPDLAVLSHNTVIIYWTRAGHEGCEGTDPTGATFIPLSKVAEASSAPKRPSAP